MMGKGNKHRGKGRKSRPVDDDLDDRPVFKGVVIAGPPYVGIIKATFMRDLMLNMDIAFAVADGTNQLPSQMVEDLFDSLRREGYKFTRDGDTICVQDIQANDIVIPDDAQLELESDLLRSSEPKPTIIGPVRKPTQMILNGD